MPTRSSVERFVQLGRTTSYLVQTMFTTAYAWKCRTFSRLGARHTSTSRSKFNGTITKVARSWQFFVDFDDNTIPGYKLYRPLYRDFVTTLHARFMKFTRRTVINLHQQSDDLIDKEGTVADFQYLVGTVHRDYVDGLVY